MPGVSSQNIDSLARARSEGLPTLSPEDLVQHSKSASFGASFQLESGFYRLGEIAFSDVDHANDEHPRGYDVMQEDGALQYVREFPEVLDITSPQQFQRFKDTVDTFRERREIAAANPWTSFFGSMSGGVASPSALLPFGAALRVGKGVSVAKNAAMGFGLGVTGGLADELVLKSSDPTRTDFEVYANLIGQGAFGSVIQGGARFLGKERSEAIQRMYARGGDDVFEAVEKAAASDAFEAAYTEGGSQAAKKHLFDAASKASSEANTVIHGGSAFGKVLDLALSVSPDGRARISPIEGARVLVNRMVSTPILFKDNAKNVIGETVEAAIRQDANVMASTLVNIRGAMRRHGASDYKGFRAFKKFREDIGEAMTLGDAAPSRITDPKARAAVDEGAAITRKYLDDAYQKGFDAGIFTSKDKLDPSYLHRVWSTDKILRGRKGADPLEGKISKWLQDEHKMGKAEADAKAMDFTTGLVHGKNHTEIRFSTQAGIASPAMQRSFRIPTDLVRDYLVTDVGEVLMHFNNSLIPQIEFAKAFSPGNAGSKAVANLRPDSALVSESVRKGGIQGGKGFLDHLKGVSGVQQLHARGRTADAKLLEETITQKKALQEALELAQSNKASREAAGTAGELEATAVAGLKAEFKAVSAEVSKQMKGLTVDDFKLRRKKNELDADYANRLGDYIDDTANRIRQRDAMDGVNMTAFLGDEGFLAQEVARKAIDPGKFKSVRRDLNAMRLKMLNKPLHNFVEPNSIAFTASRLLKKAAFLQTMGGVTLSSAADIFMSNMVNGTRNTFKSFAFIARNEWESAAKFIANPEKFGANLATRDSFMSIIAATELHGIGHRAAMVYDIQHVGHLSKFERFMDGGINLQSQFSLIRRWNHFWKTVASFSTMNRVMRDGSSLAQGKKLSRSSLKNLEAAGISSKDAGLMGEMFQKHGEIDGGQYLARSDNWTEGLTGRELVEAERIRVLFQNAVMQDVDRTILTPSVGTKPILLNAPILDLFGQFKTFTFDATSKILVHGLQRGLYTRDLHMVNNLTLLTTGGVLSYLAKESLAGREINWSPDNLASEGLDRSGALGWLGEAHNFANNQFGLSIQGAMGLEPPKRFKKSLLAEGLGPGGGVIERGGRLLKPLLTPGEPFTEGDIHRANKFFNPLESVFYLRNIFEGMEDSVQNYLNLPKSSRKAKRQRERLNEAL